MSISEKYIAELYNKIQESTVKAPVKKAAAKKVKESEAKTQSDADVENEEG